jgi:L-asparaginase II
MKDIMTSKPIFAFTRKDIPEVIVHGIVMLKHQGQVLVDEDASTVVVTRSLLKPWQAMATGGFNGQRSFWSMSIASHSGLPIHIDQLKELIRETSVSETDLVCPRALPLDANIAALMRQTGQSASRLHHPCAGKHLLMLAAAKREGSVSEGYWHEDHPVQKRIQALVGREASERLTWVIDSCGLPVAAMPIRALMNMFERFAVDPAAAATDLKSLWLEHPRLIGGARRLDSDIVEMGSRQFLAKEGADGLLMIQSLPIIGESIASCFVKISSGYHTGHLGIALWCLLSSRNDLNGPLVRLRDYLRSRLEEWVPKDQRLEILYRPSI